MKWLNDICVGIGKDEPVGLWLCPNCRNTQQVMKNDVINLKNDVRQLKECTDSILSAVNGLSSQLDSCIGGLQDRLTALSKRINANDKSLVDSLDILKSSTNTIKTAFDQKTNQILNKTNTAIEKVKLQTESFKTIINQSKSTPNGESTEAKSNLNQRDCEFVSTKTPNKQPVKSTKPKYKNVQAGSKSAQKSTVGPKQSQNFRPQIANDVETIDLTNETAKKINQSTLLIGSSLLKGVRTSDLMPNRTVRSFSGVKIDTLGEKICKYDISSCKTIILHVGGNDADSGVDLTTFSENYVSLLNSLDADNRRIVVSGLLPRGSADLRPYNQKLKERDLHRK